MDGIAEFFERAGGGRGCCMEHFLFWIIQSICTSAGQSVGGWGLGNVVR